MTQLDEKTRFLKQYIDQPRMRMVKPQLMKHELMSELELKLQLPFKYAFIGLFFFCNRWGCFRWQPIRLGAEIFPHLSIDFKLILDTFESVGMIRKYSYGGEFYGCIPSWSLHQRIPEHEPQTPTPCLDPWTNDIFFEYERSKGREQFLEPTRTSSVFEVVNSIEREGQWLSTPKACDAVTELSSNNLIDAVVVLPVLGKEGEEGKGKGWGEGGGRGSQSGSESGRGSGSRRQRRSLKRCDAQTSSNPSILEVFEKWKTAMGYHEARLDPKRQKLIHQALEWGYSIEALCEAIEGCRLTPHNQGYNDRGERYDSLSIILRSADQVDRFRRNYRSPPKILDEAERRLRANIENMENFFNTTEIENNDERVR